MRYSGNGTKVKSGSVEGEQSSMKGLVMTKYHTDNCCSREKVVLSMRYEVKHELRY